MEKATKTGTEVSAKDYQKELMKDQPVNRTQTPRANGSTDQMDMGSGKKTMGKTLTDDAIRAPSQGVIKSSKPYAN